MPHNEPTIASILEALAAQFDGPVAERQVLDRVLEQRPSSAKNPYATIRERLRWEGPSLGWLRLDRNELVPVRIVLQGLRFRYIPITEELETGLLPVVRFQPFVGLHDATPHLQDATGTPLPGVSSRIDTRNPRPESYFDLSRWYAHTRFALGDSIIITIVKTEPLTLQLVREAAADFRKVDVAAQDKELLNAIVERVSRSRLPLTPCDELVLPVFARAQWRTGYPGHAWQHLVAYDGRVQLVNDVFLTHRRNTIDIQRSGFQIASRDNTGDSSGLYQHTEDTQLAVEIDMLQQELRRSRQQDAEAGLWTGQLQRASVNQFDTHFGQTGGFERDILDALQDYESELDVLSEEDWDAEDWEDDDLLEDIDDLDIDDFFQQNPDLLEASQRLMAALPPDTLERLQNASMEEAEVLIAAHLNDLLVREPSLFVKMDLSPAGGQSDGNNYNDLTFDMPWNEDVENWEDDWEDELDVQIPSVYKRSSELMNQFHDHLIASGKSDSTARARTRDLWVYAEFLAYYYDRTLTEGDYATLDECLFFFYPRKVMSSTPRQAREICTSLKQFYGFLKERGDIADDQFAQALWRRRDQAARVVELYERISSESPDFERLFVRLFAPYSL